MTWKQFVANMPILLAGIGAFLMIEGPERIAREQRIGALMVFTAILLIHRNVQRLRKVIERNIPPADATVPSGTKSLDLPVNPPGQNPDTPPEPN